MRYMSNDGVGRHDDLSLDVPSCIAVYSTVYRSLSLTVFLALSPSLSFSSLSLSLSRSISMVLLCSTFFDESGALLGADHWHEPLLSVHLLRSFECLP